MILSLFLHHHDNINNNAIFFIQIIENISSTSPASTPMPTPTKPVTVNTTISSSLSTTASTPSTSECHEVPGVICPCACRVPTYDECSSYFQCQEDGTACKKFCPEGLYFNKREMVCDLPENVECRGTYSFIGKLL